MECAIFTHEFTASSSFSCNISLKSFMLSESESLIIEYTNKPFIKAKSSSTANIDKIIRCEKFTVGVI
jgi:hypothetical protein